MSDESGHDEQAAGSIDRLADAFENGTLQPGEFNHEAHIKVGWWYLRQYELLEAVTRFSAAIAHLTRKLGVADKYHETITFFYLLMIAERLGGSGGRNWTAFKADNPDLFARGPGLLQSYYSDELLHSAKARRQFVVPDLLRSA